MSWAIAQRCNKLCFRAPVAVTDTLQQPHDADQRSGVDFFFPDFSFDGQPAQVYPATGSMCPPVLGMKPAHLNFVLQLSQPMRNHTPMCEYTGFVWVIHKRRDVQSIVANLSHGRTSLSYLCRSWVCAGLSFHRDNNPAALRSCLVRTDSLGLLLCTLSGLVRNHEAMSQPDCKKRDR